MRTNIELDDDLLAEAAKYSTSRSKRHLVHEALATFVAVKAEERRLAGVRLKTDLRDLVRTDRDSR